MVQVFRNSEDLESPSLSLSQEATATDKLQHLNTYSLDRARRALEKVRGDDASTSGLGNQICDLVGLRGEAENVIDVDDGILGSGGANFVGKVTLGGVSDLLRGLVSGAAAVRHLWVSDPRK